MSTKRAGKDTVFDILKNASPGRPRIVRMAFADPLKDEVAQALGVSREFVETHKAQLRGLLQQWGTEARRALWGSDYWVKKMRFNVAASAADWVVITDCRFWNEIDFVRSLGGQIVRVFRVSEDETHDGEAGHETERFSSLEALPYDDTVFNTGGVPELVVRTRELYDKLLAQWSCAEPSNSR